MSTKLTTQEAALGLCIIASCISVLLTAGTYVAVQKLLSRQAAMETELLNPSSEYISGLDTSPLLPDPCMPSGTLRRGWGPEEATGFPDTLCGGDYTSAWASLSTDDQDEWLLLTYPAPIKTTQISVYETYNPGALTKITAINGKKETTLWQGKDPAMEQGNGVFIADFQPVSPVTTTQIKLYINSKAVPGWNEIDAVGIRGDQGDFVWATEAKASSTYAVPSLNSETSSGTL